MLPSKPLVIHDSIFDSIVSNLISAKAWAVVALGKGNRPLHSCMCSYDLPRSELDYLFDSINGLLYTGGSLSLLPNTTYYQTAKYLFDRSVTSNVGVVACRA